MTVRQAQRDDRCHSEKESSPGFVKEECHHGQAQGQAAHAEERDVRERRPCAPGRPQHPPTDAQDRQDRAQDRDRDHDRDQNSAATLVADRQQENNRERQDRRPANRDQQQRPRGDWPPRPQLALTPRHRRAGPVRLGGTIRPRTP
ncbi:hypothetical protein ACU686_09150 [Yinghuangia aomiensis]